MAGKLSLRGYDGYIIRDVLNQLEAQGLLNDGLLARELLSKFKHQKPSGSRRIVFELRRRGITQTTCDQVLDGYSPDEEKTRAVELAHEKWKKLGTLALLKRKKRVYDFLLRRGFEYTVVSELMDRLVRESSNED